MAAKPLVLVTGPSGFIGAHVLAALLKAGYRVRGTLRSDRHIPFLQSKYPDATSSGDLSFVIIPDLQAPHALDDAVSDVDYICHVASPYFLATSDPWKELVLPAVEGTRNVLASAVKADAAAGKLKRVVVLSSFAAVNNINKMSRPGYVYTEADWNPITEEQAHSGGSPGYLASKTFAERAAWDVLRGEGGQKPGWDLVTLCPPMVYGPPLHEVDASKGVDGLGTSLKGMITALTGKNPDFAPRVGPPRMAVSVDVRDVAEAHVKALQLPQGTSERFILCQGSNFFEDGLVGLRERNEKGLGEKGDVINKSDFYSLDVSKAEKELGMKWIPFTKTVEDTWATAKGLGIVKG